MRRSKDEENNAVSLFVLFLMVHGILGGLDVIINHELIVGLPRRPGRKAEQRMHSAREAIFASLFLAIAWREWPGAWIALPAGLMLAEFLVSLRDVAIEGDTRILPVTESTLHVALFVNLGAVYAFGGQQLWAWVALPTALMPAQAHPGWPALVLSALACLAFGWSVRDAISAWRAPANAVRGSNRVQEETLS